MGGVVLLGLILLAWMLVQFGGMAILPFTNGRSNVTVITDRADGIGEGSAVLYRGVGVGQVREVRMSDDMRNIVLLLQLEPEARVPDNVEAVIRPQGLVGGGASIFLELTGPNPSGRRLMPGAELPGHVGTLDLLPKEFTALAESLRKTTEEFRESGVLKHLDEVVVNISNQATRAGEVMESVQKLVGDEDLKRNIDQSLANINEATATANKIAKNLEKFSDTLDRTGQNLDRLTGEATETVRDARLTIRSTQGSIDQLTKSIGERLTQVAGMLDSMSSVARKMDQGSGTAGMMVNDPKLYEALVDSAKQLNGTLADLKRLVEQWEQEGVTLRLNK